MSRKDVVVVGAGIGGAATAYWLARLGHEVTLLERFDLGHEHGSSHGASRIFRLSYDETHWVADAVESLQMWRAMEEETGATLITTTGGFDIGEQALVHQKCLEECGQLSVMLSAKEAQARFPLIAFPEDLPVLFQPDAGIAHADNAVHAYVQAAIGKGVEYIPHTQVTGVEVDDEGVRVLAGDDIYEASVVVIAAGAWGKGLLGDLGIDLKVKITRETVAYFATERGLEIPSVVDWTKEPPFFSLWDPDTDGLKTGWHHAGAAIEHPGSDTSPDQAIVQGETDWVLERFPGANPKPIKAETCLYTTTEDERFVIERHGRVVVGSACSGHGFKFGPLSGKRIAEAAMELL